MNYKQYAEALFEMGVSRQQLAGLLGIHDTALSRRLSGKHTPVTEAQTTIEIVHEIFSLPKDKLRRLSKTFPYDKGNYGHIGWLVEMSLRHKTTGIFFD